MDRYHLDEVTLNDTILKAKDWALIHGLAFRPKDNYNIDTVAHLPFSLFPSPVPRTAFEEVVRLQPHINQLIHDAAHDDEFLEDALQTTIKTDEFTRNLYKIYEQVKSLDQVSLGLLRSDYLLDKNEAALKLVEVNTISTSFASLSDRVAQAQSFILKELDRGEDVKNMPPNKSDINFAAGLIEAARHYSPALLPILFIVEEVTYNISDQRLLEYELKKQAPGLQVIRRSFKQLHGNITLGQSKELLVDSVEVSVVYYRTAYHPDLCRPEDWSIRLLIETSKAIKCPSIRYHLAGSKKVQQVLANPGVVERFVKNPEIAGRIRAAFVENRSLDLNEDGDKAYNLALTFPENYVLKPQLEGGGNNVYGSDIPPTLMKLGRDRQAYILMGRIRPPTYMNVIVRRGETVKTPLVSELGIFGVILSTAKGQPIMNVSAGHLLRSKPETVDEGGVAAGLGCLDSPYLV